MQQALGWKRITGSDVTKCYQQAAQLAEFALDECERQLMGEHLNQRLQVEEFKAQYRSKRNEVNELAAFVARLEAVPFRAKRHVVGGA